MRLNNIFNTENNLFTKKDCQTYEHFVLHTKKSYAVINVAQIIDLNNPYKKWVEKKLKINMQYFK